jgi:phage repressor protein C with HTH and peptisase S24 domain
VTAARRSPETLDGGEGRLSTRAEASAEKSLKIRRALGQETDPAASSFLAWLENAGARIVYPDEEERNLRVVPIRMAEAELGAGSSFFYEDEQDSGRSYAFREDFIQRLGAPKSSLRLFRVRGDSMSPDILPGDTVLVQFKEDILPKDGDVLVVRFEQELLIKKIFKSPGGKLLLKSRNETWPEITVYPGTDDFQIIGIPRWIGREL